LWQIDSSSYHIEKKLKKFKSDKAVSEGFKRTVRELANSDNPQLMGDPKHGKYRYCYAIHITKSHSLLYRVFNDERVIQLVDLDDHKNLYGRDNRP
jgi:addiction module RelE/StbE family toxin